MINRVYLDLALTSIADGGLGPHLLGAYSAIETAALLPSTRDAIPQPVVAGLRGVRDDLWAALTVLWRVEWQRQMKLEEHLDDTKWMYFVAADVRELHVALRSFYDNIVVMVAPFAAKSGQIPPSYRKLLQWMVRPSNEGRLDPEFRVILADSLWFWDLRDVRDALVHEGAQSLVFPQLNPIGFQVHDRRFAALTHDGMMINENIVNFQLYAATQVGQAIGLLQRFCGLILQRLSAESSPQVRAHHPGLGVLVSWAEPIVRVGQ